MLLQVLSVKETTWKGTLQQARRCRKMLRRGIGNPSQDVGLHPFMPSANSTLLPTSGPSNHPSRCTQWGWCPPSTQDQVPLKTLAPGLQQPGCARQILCKDWGSRRARCCQTAKGPNWCLSATYPSKIYETCCHSLVHQPDRSSKSRLPTRFHFSSSLISVLNYKLIMGSH